MINQLKKLLTDEIINSKHLKNLDYDYVYLKLEKFILTYGDIFKKLKIEVEKKGIEGIEKNKYFKEIVKRVRSELNIVYSSFLSDDFSKKDKILNAINSKEEILELLKFHKSTKERIKYYDEIYTNIFNWHKPKKIADLACGLNPLSYFLIEEKLKYSPKYFASDLSSLDMDFIQLFFNKFKINGVAKNYDITDMKIFEDINFNSCEMVFLFKALDSFEEVRKDLSKVILEKIEAKYIVVSFPTKSLQSKKQFKIEKRNWLFNFIKKMNWSYEQFQVDNELFIMIEK